MADFESELVGCTDDLSREFIELVVVATGDHVNVAEHAIRVIKERSKCILADLPWKLPVSLTKWILHYVRTRINSPPRPNSGQSISARALFKGVKLDYTKDTFYHLWIIAKYIVLH